MIDGFREYLGVLRKWQMFLLAIEILLGMIRVFTQTVFALGSSLALIQPLVLYFVYSKHANLQECQLYILIGLIIIYSIVMNQIEYFSNLTIESILTEQFIMNYKNWGYWVEVVFRIFSVLIGWRSYQFYKILLSQQYPDTDRSLVSNSQLPAPI